MEKVKKIIVRVKFQSHNGSIATYIPTVRENIDKNFNPIMVRLRHAASRQTKFQKGNFNPIMVRLRHGQGGSLEWLWDDISIP